MLVFLLQIPRPAVLGVLFIVADAADTWSLIGSYLISSNIPSKFFLAKTEDVRQLFIEMDAEIQKGS